MPLEGDGGEESKMTGYVLRLPLKIIHFQNYVPEKVCVTELMKG
jgi:hypothetical protein